jgi:predicted Fe-Mo cluster-binding NifX family protein
MKIAITSKGPDVDSEIDPRFGRCQYFVIVETDDMGFKAFENDNAALSGSAGIQSASFVASRGVKAVLTGNCGPKASQVLSAAGIEIFTGQEGGILAALERYKKGDLLSTFSGNVPEKYGLDDSGSMSVSRNVAMAAGGGRGVGGCGGRGMGGGGKGMGGCGKGIGNGRGRGGGKGMDGGMGRGLGGASRVLPAVQKNSGELPKENELKQLKEQAGELKKQMEKIQSRIKSLE